MSSEQTASEPTGQNYPAPSEIAPRVGYLTGEFPRATDTFIQREVTALREQGNEVDTFAVRRPGPEHLVGPEQRDIHANTSYLLEAVKSPKLASAHLKLLVRSPKRYTKALRLAWETRQLGIKGSVYQLIYFAEAGILAAEISQRRIGHLHNHFGDSSCTVAMLGAALADVPYSFTLHGPAIFFEGYSWRLDEKLRRSAFCACISYFARSQAAVFAPEALDKIQIVHCGIDPDRMTPVQHLGQATRMLFVGRMANLKGLIHLLDAVSQLSTQYPDLRLTLVGDGPDRGRFEKEAQKRKLDDVVDFVGSKSQSEVADLLAQSEIFVLPSYAEGVPVVLMEALGSGVAAVATSVGGVGELIEDGISGFLTRPSDADHLADRIKKLIDDPELRQAFGAAGQAKVKAEFNSSTEAAKLAQHFAEAQSNHSIGHAIGQTNTSGALPPT